MIVPRHTLEVDAGAIRANAARLAELAGRAQLWAVVKADAYGHGTTTAAEAALAGGATRLACSTLAEAYELREAVGSRPRVLVLAPLGDGEERSADGFEIVVSSLRALQRLQAAGARCGVHVKVDTGMGRWGMSAADALAAGSLVAADPNLVLEGLMSHLATADESDTAFALEQGRSFAHVAGRFPPCPRHLANSAATLLHPGLRLDAVRCGIALYGVSPDGGDAGQFGLRPAMRWWSRIHALKDLPKGGSAGYGRRLIADRPTRIALVPVGYADGYPRLASGRSDVLIRGVRRRIAATISMDQLSCVVDDDVEVGDEVTLLGRQGAEEISAEELARAAETIGYEIVCSIGAAAPRRGVRARIRQ